MWRASLHSSEAIGSESEPSLPEFDAIIATPQGTIEGLRRHIRCLVGAVEKESSLVAVIQLLEAERQGLSDPSTTAEIRSGENNILSSASSAVAKLSLNCESRLPSVSGFTTTPVNSKFNSVNPGERSLLLQQQQMGEAAAAENVNSVANRVEEGKMEGAMKETAAPEGPFSLSPQPSSPECRRESQVNHGRRAAVSAESLPLNAIQGYRPPVVPKSPEEECVVRAGVMSCHLFSNMDIKDQTIIVHALRRETFPAGTDILKQDGPSVEKLFLLTRGSCEVIKKGKMVHTLLEGSTFGEMEMMYNLPTCVATVRSVTNCVLYTLDQFTYQHIVLAVSLHKRSKYEALLRNVKFLSAFSNYDRMQIAEAIVTKTYYQDDYIIRFGEAGRWLHLIVEGEVSVVARDRGKKREILRLCEGDVIGELEFLFNELAVADVIATSRQVTTGQIKRKHFELITGPIQDHLKEYVATSGKYTHYLGEANAQIKAELSVLAKRSKRMASKAERENTLLDQVDACGEIVLPVPKKKVFSMEKGIGVDRINGTAVYIEGAVNNPEAEPSSAHVLFRFPLMPLHENLLAMIALCEDGSILLWNEMMVRLTGYTAEEAIGQHVCSFLLETKDQKAMHEAICGARRYAGDTEAFFDEKSCGDRQVYTFARMDGITKVKLKLGVVPPIVSHGKDAAEIVLVVGEEQSFESQQVLDKSQLLIDQISGVLRDGECSYEDRLHRVATVLSGFDVTCRAMMASTVNVREVNIRQMIGQVIMDYGTQCVSSGVAVRQRFEGLYAENAYLNAKALPECLRYAMSNCAQHLNRAQVTITVRPTESNGTEFLEIEFHDDGPGFPVELLDDFHDGYVTEATRHLYRVQEAMARQGGTMLIESMPGNTTVLFIVPFVPAQEKLGGTLVHHVQALDTSMSLTHPDSGTQGSGTPSVGSFSITSGRHLHVGKRTFTTVVVEDVPAHRNMLCRFLWERKHAVLPAYNLDDIEQLVAVVDILFIDPHQSIFGEGNNALDPITLLREKARRMAVVVTGVDMDRASTKAYQTAGFLTLKKPCNPIQALHCIRKAEEMILQYKLEAERIAQTRETLSKNSRGAWQRGKLLGKGMFGKVYEATEVLTGGKMAVKEMKLGRRNLQIDQFVNEVSAMCNLRHPNIIHYFYCEENKGENVIRVFMEYAAGGNLQQLLKAKGKLDFKEYQSLLRDVVEGVAYIHSMNYVHGDLKTANVLLSAEGRGKIGDFGTARRVQEGELLYKMQGSPLYMSPECLSASDRDEDGVLIGYSFPSDIWSLGCIALEMATNKPPFSHLRNITGPAGLLAYVTNLHDTPDLSPLFDGPPSVVEFVSACLNPDSSKRATAGQLLHMTIFSEATNEDMKSALKALKRAQLLQVLNNFVAFEEPEDLERRRSQQLCRCHRRRQADFCDSCFGGDDSTVDEGAKEEGEDDDSDQMKAGDAARATAHLSLTPVSKVRHDDGDESHPARRSHTKSGSVMRSPLRVDEDAFFASSTSPSPASSGEKGEAEEREGGDSGKTDVIVTASREKRVSTCPRSSTLGPLRDDFLSTFTPTVDSFALDNRYIAFMGCSIDNPRTGAAGDSVLQEAPLQSPGTLPVRPPQRRESHARHPHNDSSFMRRGFTQLLELTYRRFSSSRYSTRQPSKLGMKNMFLVEDLQAVSEEVSPNALSSHARMLPTRSHHSSRHGSTPRQRRFAVAPHLKSPSPASPMRGTEENTRFVPSSGTVVEVGPYPLSPDSPVARKGVVSLGKELVSMLRTVLGLLERMKKVRPREREASGRLLPRQATGDFLPPKSSECQEDEVDIADSAMVIRELVGRVEREFVSLKSQTGVE
ncbi:putative protein kinase [Trypanosoma rangeli]|uniref:Protein kinase n=1 Tax=Trypanosoma rangeli TaxID=5698 RepID=A0A422NRA4_TRYRA|nr:putative protein kinase [Trypanosoma rangeli]RNF07976.1 putative protein kinase [Trypanosoma rangeli]|eukprot:RNF07976.1 putative protein kinase [Trypanosoma rangeli]